MTVNGTNGMQAVARQTLGDHVYEQLRDAIMRGEIAGGTEMNQVELAEKLGVSRVPVREALRRLQAERLVDANPFQRFVVTKLTEDQVLELFDLRAELEVFGALRARKSDSYREIDLPAAREAGAKLDVAMSSSDWLEADMAFHRLLSGRNAAVTTIIDEIRFRIYQYLHLDRPDRDRRIEVLAEHAGIIEALHGGSDDEVRAAITDHVCATRDRLALFGSSADVATER